MIIFNKEKDLGLFINRLVALTPEEFMGLAKVLDVMISVVDPETGDYKVKEAEALIDEMAKNFCALPHKERKFILKAMKR